MVNDRIVDARNLTGHPLAEADEEVDIYTRGAPFMAVRAEVGGRLILPNGIVKTFHAGDYICTEVPPQTAWILDEQGFAVSGFTHLGKVGKDGNITFPIAAADHEVASSPYTGRQEIDPELPVGSGSTDTKSTAAVITGANLGMDQPVPDTQQDEEVKAATAEIAIPVERIDNPAVASPPTVEAPPKAGLPQGAPVGRKAPSKK